MQQTGDAKSPSGLRGFWSLFVTQFQGAFSDNALKWLAIFLIAGMGFSNDKRDQLVGVVGALFALPFIVFSMAGGFLADRFSKRTVTIGVKVFEIVVMLLALIGLATNHLYLTIGCVFLMGVHSAFFGPSKYGLLPELLPEKKLSWGNGVLELGTFLAIILGTVAGGWLCSTFTNQQAWSGALLIALAVFGLVASLGITRVPPADPAKKFRANFPAELWTQVKLARKDRVLWLAVLGNTYFFAIAALIQLLIVIYASDVLGITDAQKTSYLQAATAIGIGLGSFAAGHLSGGKIEYGLIPLGSLGLTICAALLGRTGLSFSTVAVELALLGFSGGFFIVPIAALLQHRPAREQRGSLLAAANLLSFIGIFLASGVYYLVTVQCKLAPPTIFLLIATATFLATIYVVVLLPDSLIRFVLWSLTRTVYRIRIDGRDNIPAKGGALFVCNHMSWVDALLLIASTDRHVRFMMYKGIYELPYVKPFARILGVIPISSEQRPREMIKSLQTASDAIKAGHIVCIFAEGQITRIGQMLPFRRGFERIMKDVDAPIIPVALDGVWGSIFSFNKHRFVWKWPRRLPYPVTVSFGKSLPSTATPFDVRHAVQDLMAAAWQHRREIMFTLPRAFVRTARVHPFRFAMTDPQTPKVSFSSALVRTVLLARRLKKVWAGQKMVGLLLPPSVPGALVNHAAMLMGKVPVNLNYTVSELTLVSCIQQCEIKTVLTSRTFLEKVKINVPGEVVFLEDVAGVGKSRAGVSPAQPSEATQAAEGVGLKPVLGRRDACPTLSEKLTAFLMAWFLPVGLLERALRDHSSRREEAHSSTRNPEPGTRNKSEPPHVGWYERLDDLATVIFSSGSTGEPKGVMLSHYNIGSNIEQMEQVFGMTHRDCVLGVLPFFHSFGFTAALCLPAVLGVGVVYHANPLDAKTIGPLVCDNEVTFLVTTPTFLQLYMRGCDPSDFGSLRAVMTAAEKLPERLATAFEERFGIRPLEGYGCTECSPAVAVNTRDFRSAGFRQVGAKRGKIGHPLPGVSVRIVDVDNPWSETVLPVSQSGLLLVRGPNVMRGYLGKPEKTAEVLRDGWYSTGDVAALDEDGFLQITDRLSRFSKIGGEMVPHIKVEEKLHELAGVTEQTFVVTSASDEKKGERLVVLHKLADEKLQSCLEKLAQSDLPNLWKPRAEAFCRVENFPLLGTGKLDLRKVKEVALALVIATAETPA
jgi:acyl-[acyl-carrier-protein]-phospholipid O-acyltransferase / long-chain-fatty-acid--[acyl-carrier-protein] ligase